MPGSLSGSNWVRPAVPDLVGLPVHGEVGPLVTVHGHPPDVPVVVEEDVLPVFGPTPGADRGIHHVVVVFGVDEGSGDVGGDVPVLAGGELVGEVVAVLVVEEMLAIRGDVVGPPGRLQDHLLLPRPHVDGIDVLVVAPVQTPHELVHGVVPADGPMALGGRRHIVHGVVGKADEPA